MRRLYIISAIVIVLSAMTAAGQGWRGIVPLHSTRADVERLIGSPTESNGLTYSLKTEQVTIYYSTSRCIKGWPHGWDVSPDVVIKIDAYQKMKLKVDQSGIDLRSFTKSENVRLGVFDYTDKNSGVSIGVKADGEVEVVQYYPSIKDDYLLCPDAVARKREVESGESAYLRPYLHYFDVSPKEELVRLEFFAEKWGRDSPQSNIYIIGYGGPEACPDEGTNRARRARDLLIQRFKIPSTRITAVHGGGNLAVWVELFVVPPGSPRPLSNPDFVPTFGKLKNCAPAP
jgi:hypothetical protein